MSNSEATLDLSWLDHLLAAMPTRVKRRKTIFDIARVGDSELAVSNIIAFYLDQDEEHGLKDLFFQSLMELFLERASEEECSKWNDVLGEGIGYAVSREWYIGGAERKFLDIVITGRLSKASSTEQNEELAVEYPWAVLIENKIHAGPYNKLEEYEKAVDSPLKAKVYLALNDPGSIRSGWHFISHSDLIARVREKLPRYFDAADDKHLILLKDYFYNLERHSMTADDQTLMRQLMALHQKRQEVSELDKIREEMGQHWTKVLDQYLKSKGFNVSQGVKYTDVRTYWPDIKTLGLPDEMEECVRIYVPMRELLDNAVFKASFELNGKFNTVHGEDIRTAVTSEALPSGLKKGSSGKIGGSTYQLMLVDKEVSAATTLADAIAALLDATLFKDESAYIKATFQQIKSKRGLQ